MRRSSTTWTKASCSPCGARASFARDVPGLGPRARGGRARGRSRRATEPGDRRAGVVRGQHDALPPRRGTLSSEGVDFPALRTRFRDRHALVVARGPGHKRDLRIVRPYIRDFKPVLIGVDGGADALLDAGYRPDVIVGDMDSVSDAALRSGAEILIHAYEGGEAPARRGRSASAFSTRSSRPRESARTWRCSWRTRRAPS